jgi:multiple sugar transport system permease protein
MLAFFWLMVLVMGVVAVVFLAGAGIAAVRERRIPLAGAVLGMAVAMTAASVSRNPFILGLASLATGAASVAGIRSATRNAADAGRVVKLSAAHLALLLGSFLFLVPFAWLISTSLKPDDEMAVFPPVWIPTQQVTIPSIRRDDGTPAGLSWYHQGRQRLRVAEVADLPTGQILIKPLPPSEGKPLTVERKQLTKIRHVAPRWENYSEALKYLPPETYYGLVFLGNTLLLTIMNLVGTLISSSLVAYSFARLKWPGRNALFLVVLATMMVPGAVTLMPQVLIFRYLGWVDTLQPLWVPAFFGSAFNIFLLRQFFLSIPGELEDAARLDGCGPFAIYWRVMLPLVKPALAAIAIMSVMGAWNNFQGPLIYLSSPEHMPLAYALQLYQQAHGGEPGLLMAASTLVVLPIIVLFFFTQRYFIEGASLTGLGGR